MVAAEGNEVRFRRNRDDRKPLTMEVAEARMLKESNRGFGRIISMLGIDEVRYSVPLDYVLEIN